MDVLLGNFLVAKVSGEYPCGALILHQRAEHGRGTRILPMAREIQEDEVPR